MITIVNLKEFRGECERVDRLTVLGNKFRPKDKSDEARAACCAEYAVWLRAKMKAGGIECAELRRLYRIWRANGELKLACWCAPKQCHADEIKKVLEAKHEAE